MPSSFRCIALCLLFACLLPGFGSDDQPSNVLIGNLTFVRPKEWRWEPPPPQSDADSRFVIPGTGGNVTDCRFYFVNNNWKNTKELWIRQFSRRGEPKRVHEEIAKIPGADLRFLTVDGDYAVNPSHAIQMNFRLVGLIIPVDDKIVRIRLVGPAADVEKATPAFKKMVMDAVKQRRVEK